MLRAFRYILIDFAIVLYTTLFGTLAILLFWIPKASDCIARIWARCILRTSGVRVEVEGLDNIKPGTPYVYMSNHLSHFDAVSLLTVLPLGVKFLAKKELGRIPFLGWAMYALGYIFVERGNRLKSFKRIDKGVKKVKEGTPVLVFAEGTRSQDGNLQPFKKGGFVMAIKAGVDIIPISISGSRGVLPRGSLRVNPGMVKVVIGSPIPSSDYSLDMKTTLMERVRTAIDAGITYGKKDGSMWKSVESMREG